MSNHWLKGDRCPHCYAPLNGAENVMDNDEPPKAGDFSICSQCYGLIRFDSQLKLVKTTPQDIMASASTPEKGKAFYQQICVEQQRMKELKEIYIQLHRLFSHGAIIRYH